MRKKELAAMKVEGFCSAMDVVATSGEPLATVASRMRFNDVGCVPIIDNGTLSGILTERDLARAVADGVDPRTTVVGDYMSSSPIVVEADETLADATRVMVDGGIRHLPVLDHGRMIGVMSMRDILAELLWTKQITNDDQNGGR
jgi:CBS domain-containing protein